MPSITIKIKVKILDYWIVDNYKLGSGEIVYALLQINDKLSLIEREIIPKCL